VGSKLLGVEGVAIFILPRKLCSSTVAAYFEVLDSMWLREIHDTERIPALT